MKTDPAGARRFPLRFWLVTIALVDAWLALWFWAGPALIRRAYRPGHEGWLSRAIAGGDPLDLRLLEWHLGARQVSFRLVTAALLAWGGIAVVRWLRATPKQPFGAGDLPRAAPLHIAIWFGLISGLGEGYHVAAQTVLMQRPAHWDWMTNGNSALLAPIAQTGVFAALALVLLAVTRMRPGPRTSRFAILLFSFLTAAGWFFVTRKIHPLGGAVLAAGIAFQTMRSASARLPAFIALTRRGAVPLAVLVSLLFVGRTLFIEGKRVLERMAAPAATGARTNVLLIVLDTERASSMRLYGADLPGGTGLDRLARSGILFRHAIAPSSWTLPSHASLFTGYPAHTIGPMAYSPLDPRYVTLADVLHADGYHTIGVAGNLFFLNRSFGLTRGFNEWVATPLAWRTLGISSSWLRLARLRIRSWRGEHDYLLSEGAEDLNRRLLRSIDRRPTDRPFFAFINYFDVHEPYDPRPGYLAAPIPPDLPTWLGADPSMFGRFPAETLRGWRTAYESESAWLEDRVGMLLDSLVARNLFEDLLVVLTSDHGEHFGEHGLVEHSTSVYRPVLDVPLVIRLPRGAFAGQTIATPVAVSDVGATILDVVGLPPAMFPGGSIAPVWETGAVRDRPIVSWRTGLLSIVHEGFHYIVREEGREELYDLADADEASDLSWSVPHAPVRRRLRALADSILASGR